MLEEKAKLEKMANALTAEQIMNLDRVFFELFELRKTLMPRYVSSREVIAIIKLLALILIRARKEIPAIRYNICRGVSCFRASASPMAPERIIRD